MKILIKNYFNDTILFEGEYDNLSIALKEAIKTNADLTNADGIEKYCYFSISPIGSENGQLWVMINEEGILIYNRGCFKGTEEEFITAVRKKHTGNKYETQYLKAIELIRLITEGENHACKSS